MHCCLLLVVDLICVAVANALAIGIASGLDANPDVLAVVAFHAVVTIAFSAAAFFAAGLNRTVWRFTSLSDCLRIVLAVGVAILAAAAVANLADYLNYIPSQFPLLQLLLMSSSLIGLRALMRVRHSGRVWRRRSRAPLPEQREDVIVIGLNPLAELYLRYVDEMAGTHIAVAGILSPASRHHGRLLRSCPILGRPENIESLLLDLEIHGVRIDRIVLAERFEALSETAQAALQKVEHDLKIPLESLHRIFGLTELFSSSDNDGSDKSDGTKALALSARASNANGNTGLSPVRSYLRWKRAIDVVVASVCLISLAPVLVVVALLVAWDVGYPVIFWQQRPGASGRPIRVFKFRTMRAARSDNGPILLDAERLSRTGRILRRMRLDELPQIYNVLIGQMSLIGPRPLLPVDQSPRFAGRLTIKPGLTGWAQIKGGRHLSQHDKAALDLWYVRHVSFGLDFRILMRTAGTVLFGETIDRSAIENAWLELGEQIPHASGKTEDTDEPTACDSHDSWRWLKAGELRAAAVESHT